MLHRFEGPRLSGFVCDAGSGLDASLVICSLRRGVLSARLDICVMGVKADVNADRHTVCIGVSGKHWKSLSFIGSLRLYALSAG